MGGTTQSVTALIKLLEEAFPLSAQHVPRLIHLASDRPVVFVGDIHGDRHAVETVFSRFPRPDHIIVFLGDIVDRGSDSLGALTLIVTEKLATPSFIHLLMGNHEARGVSRFRPADFWDDLTSNDCTDLARVLLRLPFAAWHPTGIMATHGALPDLLSMEAMDTVEPGSEAWRAMTWGDWVEADDKSVFVGSRPAFGPSAFEKRSFQLGVRLHVRSHQPSAPRFLFQDRCLTLFTSNAYNQGHRHIAQWVPGQEVSTARDLQLINI
ncbi:serine/threonine protein phosphatase [Candidatus Bipolaricaulota bacterium]|nr:serine/threonine protein phosphatase [Candidatus Bipolaricaulota bacterium]